MQVAAAGVQRGEAFYDRDVSAALNIRRCAVGPGPRPTELCYWDGRPAMPKPGRTGQEWVYLRDKALLRSAPTKGATSTGAYAFPAPSGPSRVQPRPAIAPNPGPNPGTPPSNSPSLNSSPPSPSSCSASDASYQPSDESSPVASHAKPRRTGIRSAEQRGHAQLATACRLPAAHTPAPAAACQHPVAIVGAQLDLGTVVKHGGSSCTTPPPQVCSAPAPLCRHQAWLQQPLVQCDQGSAWPPTGPLPPPAPLVPDMDDMWAGGEAAQAAGAGKQQWQQQQGQQQGQQQEQQQGQQHKGQQLALTLPPPRSLAKAGERLVLVQMPPHFDVSGDMGVVGRVCVDPVTSRTPYLAPLSPSASPAAARHPALPYPADSSSSGRSEGRSDTESEAGTDPGGPAMAKEVRRGSAATRACGGSVTRGQRSHLAAPPLHQWGEGWEGGEGRTLRLDLKGELLQVPCGPLAYSIALVKLAPAAGTALVECLFTSLSCAMPDRAAAAQLAGCDLAGVMDDDEEEVYRSERPMCVPNLDATRGVASALPYA
ncbi:hypothetical protein QJQ45_017535 [Haematococcus lacustris]|nr:hypothetical protein QJQ45_017535 [Haematococcus lacustris]